MRKHKLHIILILLLFKANVSLCQQKQNVDELKKQLATAGTDTAKFRILDLLTTDYLWYADQTDSAYIYAKAEWEMANKLNQPFYLAEAYLNSGWWLGLTGNVGAAVEQFTKAKHLAEENHFNEIIRDPAVSKAKP